ncbi:prolyl-tRNA synthetase associated domain-containing protein [Tenuifilum thalassicum]|uniref:Prolyl-tRNA synthetase associated domain-containing protein n=1 Tax=Tenuifilum thalassicum TaxID=2590900 RepID=A0A7D4BF15_9BACT|nr:prolyl-tRNA synthetase associated domain-containing protein [Tenuifilum thalassicum]QKG81263.1 prolyl-tRNA synthetase associated domain-containing protein [Tenuifilum thalassicum]
MDYRGDPQVYGVLKELNIPFEYHEHPEAPTVEIASQFWDGIDSAHCKNLFFRNHKGNKHYLVILEYRKMLNIKQLEKLLKQGKLTFASPKRMHKYLNLTPGSVSPFGLIHDTENHVHLFIDQSLKETQKISFHPNLNTASLVITTKDFFRYLDWTGNSYEFIDYVIE